MKILLFKICLVLSLSVTAQTYSYEEIKSESFSIVERQVGKELLVNFNFFPDITYNYSNLLIKNGVRFIKPKDEVKAKKVDYISTMFIFENNTLDSLNISLYFFLDLDKDLRALDTINLNRIPKFIRLGEQCNWLLESSVDSIIENLHFNTEVKEINKSIFYNPEIQGYCWLVSNKYESDYNNEYFEYFYLDIVSGEVKKQYLTQSRRSCTRL